MIPDTALAHVFTHRLLVVSYSSRLELEIENIPKDMKLLVRAALYISPSTIITPENPTGVIFLYIPPCLLVLVRSVNQEVVFTGSTIRSTLNIVL